MLCISWVLGKKGVTTGFNRGGTGIKERINRWLEMGIGFYSLGSFLVNLIFKPSRGDGMDLAFRFLTGLFFLILSSLRNRRDVHGNSEIIELVILFFLAIVVALGIFFIRFIKYLTG